MSQTPKRVKDLQIFTRLDEEQYTALKEVAVDLGESMSSVARIAIESYLIYIGKLSERQQVINKYKIVKPLPNGVEATPA